MRSVTQNRGDCLKNWRNAAKIWCLKATNAVPPAVQGGGPSRGYNCSTKGIRCTRLVDQLLVDPLVLDRIFSNQKDFLSG